MNYHFTPNMMVKFTALFYLLSGFGMGIAQETGNTSAKLLSKASRKTSQAESYTIKKSKILSKEMSRRNGIPMKNKTYWEIRYEKPYFFMKMKAGSGGGLKNKGVEAGPNTKQKTIGKIHSESGRSTFYIKSVLSGNKWENMNKLPFVSGSFFKMGGNKKCIMCGSLPNPRKRFKNINLAGSETINGKKCYKIMAKIRESAMNKKAQNMLKGPMKKMVADFKMDVLSSPDSAP